jgi:hypothetical protein
LCAPRGRIASFEADILAHICDPPLPALTRLLHAYIAYSAAQGIDLFIGRRTHRLLREAGVVDIETDAVVHVYPRGHDRRTILRASSAINWKMILQNSNIICRGRMRS